jgi:hypothetical protein
MINAPKISCLLAKRSTTQRRKDHFHANSAWLQCAVLAHNLIRWSNILGNARTSEQLIGARTTRTRLLALPARIVNRAGRPTLRLPTRWPWADTFTITLHSLRALKPLTG